MGLDRLQAQKIIEALRTGIPPDGFVKKITVGRESEIKRLDDLLHAPTHRTLLIRANYGMGKTHLLRYIREIALEAGYVVSLITLDAKSGVAFNKFDQVFGEVNRRIEIPSNQGQKGIRVLFDMARQQYNFSPDDKQGFWALLSNQHKWNYESSQLKSPAMYIALRAWFFGDERTKDLIEDWLYHPANYKSQGANLYRQTIGQFRKEFRDLRADHQIIKAGGFDFFNKSDYQRCWDALCDIDSLARASGFRGFIILVDEFEDVISNIPRKAEQQDAFWRLFEFFSESKFDGLSFFAVTPDFVQKCKTVLIEKNVFDFDYTQFEKLPAFSLAPLEKDDLIYLAQLIVQYHETAYGVSDDNRTHQIETEGIVHKSPRIQIRDFIKEVVRYLDNQLG